MFGISLTTEEKTGLAIAGGILATLLIAPNFFPDDSLSKSDRRLVERAEKTIDKIDDYIGRLESHGARNTNKFARQKAHDSIDYAKEDREVLRDFVRQIERGEKKGPQLRRFLASNRMKIRARNPDSMTDAEHDSQTFHGEPREVIRLTEAERRPASKYATVIGHIKEIDYVTPSGSQRSGAIWDHHSGDGGPYGHSDKNPLIVEDPETHLLHIVEDGARTHFSPQMGILF